MPPPLVLYRDAHVVAVDKPAGTVVHRGWANDDAPLLQAVRDLVGQHVFPLHRLDRGASGVVLFALEAKTASTLARVWHDPACIDKRYLAITRGVPPAHVLIDHPIPREPNGERVPATTELWLRETFGRYALVEARPLTGRLHQIRRHLKHLACPLVGDVKYGKGEHNRVWRSEHGLHRLALHATSLTFPHPETQLPVAVHAPLPADLAAAVASARTAYVEPHPLVTPNATA